MFEHFVSALARVMINAPTLIMVTLIIVTVALGTLLRWFVSLKPDARKDVIRLVKALRKR